jgi:hypothetical protein
LSIRSSFGAIEFIDQGGPFKRAGLAEAALFTISDFT